MDERQPARNHVIQATREAGAQYLIRRTRRWRDW
jgi:hypothetical protein